MWPLIKKQLHQTKTMRKLQPELKRIKKAAAGDRQKESMLMMELYKERGVNPFSQILLAFVQLPIFITLFSALRRVVDNPQVLVDWSYGFIQDLGWMKNLAGDITRFDNSLLHIVDLSRAALPKGGGVYWPALIIVLLSGVLQYFQSKQLMPQSKQSRSLRSILREAGSGKQAEQEDISAAVGRSTSWLLPIFIVLFTIGYPSALSLYFLTGSVVAYIQQWYILRKDTEEMEEEVAEIPVEVNNKPVEAEVIQTNKTKTTIRYSKSSVSPVRKKKTRRR